LASLCVAVGFAHSYRPNIEGVVWHGLIAVAGMAITLVMKFTVLPGDPDLLRTKRCRGRWASPGDEQVDRLLQRHRWGAGDTGRGDVGDG